MTGSHFSRPSFNPRKDLPSLKDKVVIVTGGNRGVGLSTIKHLARCGATVYMAARSEARAKEAIASIEKEGLAPGNGKVEWISLDLSDPKSVKKTGEDFIKNHDRLDVLINNAAILLDDYKLNEYGVLESMQVNVVSPFILTQTLLPLLKKTADQPNSDVRIVTVSSAAHSLPPKDTTFSTLEGLNAEHKKALAPKFARYTASKLAALLLSTHRQHLLPPTLLSIAVDPGPVNSFSTLVPGVPSPVINFFAGFYFQSTDVGAHTSVIAAASQEIRKEKEKEKVGREGLKGGYVGPPGVLMEPQGMGRDVGMARELWGVLEGLCRGPFGMGELVDEVEVTAA